MKNYFIIHGSFVDSNTDWYPWLRDKLIELNQDVIAPNFPVGLDIQNYDAWKNELNKYKDKINENTVFIAHSIGPIFIVKYVIENNIKIDSLYSISGFNGLINIKDFDKVNESFFMKEIKNFDKKCKNRISFFSNNDPFVPYELLEDFPKLINSEVHIINNAGHFIEDDGYNEFPELLSTIIKNDNIK